MSNWLALLAILALGIVWPGSEALSARSQPLAAARAAEPLPLAPER